MELAPPTSKMISTNPPTSKVGPISTRLRHDHHGSDSYRHHHPIPIQDLIIIATAHVVLPAVMRQAVPGTAQRTGTLAVAVVGTHRRHHRLRHPITDESMTSFLLSVPKTKECKTAIPVTAVKAKTVPAMEARLITNDCRAENLLPLP